MFKLIMGHNQENSITITELEDKIKLIMWNCHSLLPKLPRFKIMLYAHKPHIVCLTETWTTTKYQPSFINYRVYWNHRKERVGAGTAILIRIDIPVITNEMQRFDSGLLESQRVQINTREGKLDILNVYNPNKNVTSEEFLHYFGQLRGNKLVSGDFNAHHRLWISRTTNNRTGNNLVNTLTHFPELSIATPKDLATYVDYGTMSQSTLDLCLISSHLLH